MSCSTIIFVCERNFKCCISKSLRNLLGGYNLANKLIVPHTAKNRGLCYNLTSQSIDESPPQQPNTKIPTKRKRKSPTAPKHNSKNIVSHLSECNDELDLKSIPKKLISRSYISIESLFVVGKNTADVIAESVTLDGNDVPVFEVNPGLGVLTKALLKKKVHGIHAFQSNFWEKTLELIDNHSNRLYAHRYDFFSLWKRLLLDFAEEEEEMEVLMRIVEAKPWNNGPPIKIFASVPSKLFINHLIASIVFQKGFTQLGRLEFYLAMRPYDYHCITCDGEANYFMYRATAVLFQIMFERTILCKLPAKDFIPWVKSISAKKKKKLPQLTEADEDCMYLVKVTPHKDLHDMVYGADNLRPLWHFVRQCFRNRSNRIIPTIEKWIPGSGPRLIFNNMTIFTEFGELSPMEVLKLFQIFSKWPEYPHCTFLESMENYFLKSYVESNPDGVSEAEFESIDIDTEGDPDLDAMSHPGENMENV